MVRLTPTDMRRVAAVAQVAGIKPATLAHMGLLEVVQRLEARAPEVPPEVATALASARARGVDVLRVLTDALEANVQAEAASAA